MRGHHAKIDTSSHLDTNGNIVVQCDAVPLALRYRWRMLLVGVQTDYQLAARSVDPVAVIANVMAGQTVQIIVQAVNGNLQGTASEPILFTMPAIVKTTAAEAGAVTPQKAAPALEIERVASHNGMNGSNGSREAYAVMAPRA